MSPPPLPTLFITGALGYLGGTFLTVLKRSQPSILVRALVRNPAQAEALTNFYGWTVTPVIGSLDDLELLQHEASKADIVIQATGDNRPAILALMEGTTQNPKHSSNKSTDKPIFIHISGASNVGHPILGEKSPRVYSDVEHWDELLQLDETRIQVGTDNAIRCLSAKKNIRSLTLAPPTILGRGLGAGKTETFQRALYDSIIANGAAYLVGKGENAWSTISVEDCGRAFVFLLEEAQKYEGESGIQFGENGYHFVEAFELKMADRAKAAGVRLYREGRVLTPEVQMKTIEEVEVFGPAIPYIAASSSLVRADKLRALGWEPVDYDWLRMVQEAPGYRC